MVGLVVLDLRFKDSAINDSLVSNQKPAQAHQLERAIVPYPNFLAARTGTLGLAHWSQVKQLKPFPVEPIAHLQHTRQSVYWRHEPEKETQ